MSDTCLRLLHALEQSTRLRWVAIATLFVPLLLMLAGALLTHWLGGRHALLHSRLPVMEVCLAVAGLVLLIGVAVAAGVCRRERLLN